MKFVFPKLSRNDVIAIVLLVAFLIVVSIPGYLPKNGCEVARPDYKCVPFIDVMKENCQDWAKYNCDTNADVSLTDIVWYTQNLCNLQNANHGTGLDCSDLKSACNQVVGSQVCPAGYVG
jgi:hypothetical protein